jgi:Fur family peroxide stress response transcriptional regulator
MSENSDKDFIAILRQHGLQVTYQRLAIYQALYHTKDHPSAEEIYQQVRKRFPMISLGTVYKTLERFHEVGLIQKVSPVTEVARYEANISHHHHLICLECQTIQDFDDPNMDVKVSLPEENNFEVMRRQVILQGYCAHCKPK